MSLVLIVLGCRALSFMPVFPRLFITVISPPSLVSMAQCFYCMGVPSQRCRHTTGVSGCLLDVVA